MLSATLLDQSRRPAYRAKIERKLGKVIENQNWQARVAAEVRDKPAGDEPVRSFAMRRGATPDPDQGLRILERIIKGNDLVSVNYLERGVECARSVCRIRLMNSSRETVGFASGFLVGRGVLMTNHHVLPTAAHCRFARAEFAYEYDVRGGDRVPVTFELVAADRPIIRADLDFCLVGVAPRGIDGHAILDDFGWLQLDPTPGKTRENEFLTIIQHPGGERKQICVRENKLIRYLDDSLWYQTDTVSGSSGSPVFNNSWQVVALHHSGVPLKDKQGRLLTIDGRVFVPGEMKENLMAWVANEGIRISSILRALREDHASHPLARRLLDAAPPPAPRYSFDAYRGAAVTVPIYVGDAGRSPAAPADREPAVTATVSPWDLTAVDRYHEVKKPTIGLIARYPARTGNLADRKGYQPNFLGAGRFAVPLPVVKKSSGKFSFNKAMTWGGGSVLPYDRHSVLVSDQRRFAIYAAVNVDDNLRHSQPKSDPEWLPDPRLGGRDVGNEFYAQSPGVKADGQPKNRKSPFDRGHQVQQEDATWGRTASAAAKASADTFYFPNAAPQIFEFNQRGTAWQGLEDYVIEIFAANTGKACVITGPIYDAPRATGGFKSGTKGLPIKPNGARSPDPKFLGLRVPKAFYKVVVCHDGLSLRAAAFIMSQQNQLDRLVESPTIDVEETLSTVQARLFLVTVDDVESLTGLDFGNNVREAQATTLEAIKQGQATPVGVELRTIADLRL